jgi:HAD superfamily hydrolase (TIGR01509 family)
MIKALVFDFDGTILDTETPDFHCWRQLFEQHGCELEQGQWCKVVGTGWDVFNPFDHLESKLGRAVDRDELFRAQKQIFHALVKQQAPMPGVEAVLATARQMGLQLAVASSSGRPWVQGHLERLGLIEYFPVIKTSEDVARVKPDPALYAEAVRALGVQPHEAVALEDSVNGVKAAKAAGLSCIAIPNSVTRDLDFSEADCVWGSLEECELDGVVQRQWTAVARP